MRVCARVCLKDKRSVPLQYRGPISPQDASAACGGLSAGGTLLSRERGFFSLRQDSHPQSHTGEEGRVRRLEEGRDDTCRIVTVIDYFVFHLSYKW